MRGPPDLASQRPIPPGICFLQKMASLENANAPSLASQLQNSGLLGCPNCPASHLALTDVDTLNTRRADFGLGRGVSLVFRLKASSNGDHPLFTTHRVMQNEPQVRSETPTTWLWGCAQPPALPCPCSVHVTSIQPGGRFDHLSLRKNTKTWS